MTYSLGIDVGSTTAKLVLLDGDSQILRLDSESNTTSPKAAVSTLLDRLEPVVKFDEITMAGVTGSGQATIIQDLDWNQYSSSLAIASGILSNYPDAATIIQIGGQSSLIIELENGLNSPWKVVSNPLCAAGTGRFLEQQAYRLGINLEDLAEMALQCEETPPRIAARCSVFAKTDLIHLQQKGVSVPAMLYSLCESIARMVVSLKKGTLAEPIYFVGGVAANRAIAKAISDVLSMRNGHDVQIGVPDNHLHIQALGAALLARDSGKHSRVEPLSSSDDKQEFYEMPALEKIPVQEPGKAHSIREACTGFLGVDVGSTSTKAVILDESRKKVLAKSYLMTEGRPIDAVRKVFSNLLRDGADKVQIGGVGVTGSGRYLVGSFIGADVVKNEITAQTRAAADIDPEADIIELGGQDSKLVIKRNGVVVDYQMNRACAAGTGSFIDELADLLGVSAKNGQFADLAFEAPHTIDLGTRCAAFMDQAVSSVQRQGVPVEVITASLSNSIAKNYLSKLVGTRKLGQKIILTGAVFYNEAVTAAFQQQLIDKTLIVAEHREVSGAMGAALLAASAMSGLKSNFKGFENTVGREVNLSPFVCNVCDNNCTITQMKVPGEKTTYFGSRCDLYDAKAGDSRVTTLFEKREELLFRDYKKGEGSGPKVGIPRALLINDLAPLLIGFLNALDARVVFSSITTKKIIEQSVELSYSDSCFPLKLLHGHAAVLDDVDFILYPSALRLAKSGGEEDQKYACPLVQASPYILRTALNLDGRFIIPSFDFSQGNKDVVKSLTDAAVQMGYGRKEGRKAAVAAIEAQHRFHVDQEALGERTLQELRESDKLGVVLFARSYMSQDSGANLGIAAKLAQLGVTPIPMDFLPLDSVNPKDYSDRPYWYYETKQIAASDLTAKDPQLFGLVLTNFGCGPNSFILRLVEDIMGSKPLGQLEIDEHAAEAGIVTRLEAFVDTIMGFSKSDAKPHSNNGIYRAASTVTDSTRKLLIPRMAPQAEVLAAALEACGADVEILPEPDERSLMYADRVTTGTECLPFRVTLGSFMKACYENGANSSNSVGLMAGAYGPCRLGKYAIEQTRILKEIGADLPIYVSVSNNGYRDLNIESGVERLAWRGLIAVDQLDRLVWRTRPYEIEDGSTDRCYAEYFGRIVDRVRKKESLENVVREMTTRFESLIDPDIPRKPRVGINGEIFLRANQFSNNDLARACELAGLEVVVSPIAEWFKFTTHRNLEDALKNRELKKIVGSYIRKKIQERDEQSVVKICSTLCGESEPSTSELLSLAGPLISPLCRGGEAILSVASGIHWMQNAEFAGVISVMPHGCMPGGIVSAMSERLAGEHGKPWISLTYDGTQESTNVTRINEFAEVIKYTAT